MKILEVISFPGRGEQSSLLWGSRAHCIVVAITFWVHSVHLFGLFDLWQFFRKHTRLFMLLESSFWTFKLELIGSCLDHSELNIHLPPFPRCQGAEGGGWHPAVMFSCWGTGCQTLHFCSRATSMSKLLFLTARATDVASYNWNRMGSTSCYVA